MSKNDNHPFIKVSGCKNEKEFNQKYPSPESFFAAYPHMRGNQTMQNGGKLRPNAIWTGKKWVSTVGDNGTYHNQSTFQNGGSSYSQTGGPVFPIGGASPTFAYGGDIVNPFAMSIGNGGNYGMLQEYANETMQNGGFAMAPGTGTGGGMLEEYATETMAKGGKPHHKKLSPKQKQMMMQAMQQAAQQKQQQQAQGDPSQGQQGQGDMQQAFGQFVQQMVQQHPEIAGAVQHHDPKIMQQLQQAFQQQIQQGQQQAPQGDPNQQQGQPQQDPNQGQQMQQQPQGPPPGMQNGGNPFHPLGRFFRDGGMVKYQVGGPATGSTSNGTNFAHQDEGDTPDQYAHNSDSRVDNGDTGVVPQSAPMRDSSGNLINDNQDLYNDSNPHQGESTDNNGTYIPNKPRQYRGAQALNTGVNAGLMIGSYYADRKNARDTASKQMLDRQSQNAFAAVNQPGGMGDYTQYGDFRPNQMTPTKPGAYYPTAKFGGNYQPNTTHDLSEQEIAQLQRQGYKIQFV